MKAKRFVETSFGRIALLEAGPATKPPVLFVHGIPTSGYLWREVLRLLQDDFHGYAPDLLGLGDSEVDPSRDVFQMDAQAEMLAELMTALGHETFALVCHDQGGAAAQLLATRFPARIVCFVLTNCVCYDNWPVPAVKRLQRICSLPLPFALIARSGFVEWLQTRTPLSDFARGVYRREALCDASIAEYLRPLRSGGDATRRFRRFVLAGHPRHTLEAVAGLKRFTQPTAVFWAADDVYISPSWGRQLADDIPGTRRFELVPFCGHFWPEERPAEFTALIAEFLAEHCAAPEPRRVAEGR